MPATRPPSLWPPEMGESELAGFARLHHVAYLYAISFELPHDYATQEVNHLTLAYFAVAGLSLLRELDRVVGSYLNALYSWELSIGYHVNKEQIANWVFSFQIHHESNNELDNGQFYGFSGSRTTQFPSNNVKEPFPQCFMPTHIGTETGLCFVYCAAAICSMLKDWTGMDKEKTKEYILNCQSYMMVALAWFLVQNLMVGGLSVLLQLYLMGFIQVDLASNLPESASIDICLLLE